MDGDARITSPTGNWFQYRWRILHEFYVPPLWAAGGNLPDPVQPYVFTISNGYTSFASTDTWQMTIAAIRDPLFVGLIALYTYWPRTLTTANDYQTLTGAKQPTWYYEGLLSGMGIVKGYLDGWIESPVYYVPSFINTGDLIDVTQHYPLSSPYSIMGRGWLMYTRTALSGAPHRDLQTHSASGSVHLAKQEDLAEALRASLGAAVEDLNYQSSSPLGDNDKVLTPGILIQDQYTLRAWMQRTGSAPGLVVQSSKDLGATWSTNSMQWTGYTNVRTARLHRKGGMEYLFGLRNGALCVKWQSSPEEWSGKQRSWRVWPGSEGIQVLPGNDEQNEVLVVTTTSAIAPLIGAGINYVYMVQTEGAPFVEVSQAQQTYGARWILAEVLGSSDVPPQAEDIDRSVSAARAGIRAEVVYAGPDSFVRLLVRAGTARVGPCIGDIEETLLALDSIGDWWVYLTRTGMSLTASASKVPPANASLIALATVKGAADALTLTAEDIDNEYDGVLIDTDVPDQNAGVDIDEAGQIRVEYTKHSMEKYRYSKDAGESWVEGAVSEHG